MPFHLKILAIPVVALIGYVPFTTSVTFAQVYTAQTGYADLYTSGTGRTTASGEIYDPAALTAALPNLAFDTMVRVTRVDKSRSIVVRVNDRPSGDGGGAITLSAAAAERLGISVARAIAVRIEPFDSSTLAERIVKRDSDAAEPVSVLESVQMTLQIGVFSSMGAAEEFSKQFRQSWIAPVSDEGMQKYRVYYSRFEQEMDARMAQRTLRRLGQDSFLRRIAP